MARSHATSPGEKVKKRSKKAADPPSDDEAPMLTQLAKEKKQPIIDWRRVPL